MPMAILEIIDALFFVFHTILILFNVFGWLVPAWRLANLITLLLTVFSWLVLGFWYGWGYCICVDWHWYIRGLLGYQNTSSSYIHFLVLKITGIDFPMNLVDTITVTVLFLVLMISGYLNIKKWKSK